MLAYWPIGKDTVVDQGEGLDESLGSPEMDEEKLYTALLAGLKY